MSLKRVHLELARCREFPDGSAARGYEFMAPIRADGSLDGEAWPQQRERCTVRRFWAGEDDETGHLVHTRGRAWAFRLNDGAEDIGEEDEPIFNFDRHRVVEGEYVSITEHDGVQRTFRIASVR